MLPLTVPLFKFPVTELELAVFIDIFDIILLERMGPDPFITSAAL